MIMRMAIILMIMVKWKYDNSTDYNHHTDDHYYNIRWFAMLPVIPSGHAAGRRWWRRRRRRIRRRKSRGRIRRIRQRIRIRRQIINIRRKERRRKRNKRDREEESNYNRETWQDRVWLPWCCARPPPDSIPLRGHLPIRSSYKVL